MFSNLICAAGVFLQLFHGLQNLLTVFLEVYSRLVSMGHKLVLNNGHDFHDVLAQLFQIVTILLDFLCRPKSMNHHQSKSALDVRKRGAFCRRGNCLCC
ncbi:hypothetical protein DFH09DRAFT_1192767 [Mycena vulgaris]|nr:hypothetical protein DFH09DRAFT_1192767 [Mycena vulgaris]